MIHKAGQSQTKNRCESTYNPIARARPLIHNVRVSHPSEVSPLADNQPVLFAESIREARQCFEAELSARAEQIRKLTLALTELQQIHERTGQEAAQRWDELARMAANADALAAAPKVSPDAALEDVLGAVRNLVTCTIPEQVFDVLTAEAAQWSVRAAIFDVRGRAAWGASAHGFGPGLSEQVLRSLIIQLGQDTPFRQVCDTAGPVEATADMLRKNRNVLDRLKPAPHAPVLLLPVRSTGAVSAIFYADPGESSASLPVNALKILAEFAGAQIDRLIALSGGVSEEAVEEVEAETAASEAPVAVAPAEVPPVEAPAPESVAPPVVEPSREPVQVEPIHIEPPLEAPTEQPAEALPEEAAPVAEAVQEAPPEEPDHAESPAETPVVEEPVMGAAVDEVHHRVEAIEPPAPEPPPLPPPIEVAPEPPEPPVPLVESQPVPAVIEPPVEVYSAPSPAPVVAEPPPPPPPPAPAVFDVTQLSEADQKAHKDARRFARLLVSEIELYNKTKVADGRKNRDLYRRLKSDIDRSRQTFDKRFGKLLSKQFDYLHDELVKTLAGNDASLLGTEYPGPIA